jgi:Na+-transporting methylmalonyl-CoA/oxaloacetate decarboxylase gamma subunit
MPVESGFAQPLWITLLGMVVTFAALGLVMAAMVLLTRLVRQPEPPPSDGADEALPPVETSADGRSALAAPGEPLAEEPPSVDLELPPGTEMAEVLAAVVAVATARELGCQRHSARVWLSAEPRSLVSPWQLVARGWQMDRSRR